jgi:hypothetical protein
MSDIFISYASQDRPRAAELARVLDAAGWQVWWDRDLVVGDHFAEVIAKELQKSACVIVMWSRSSIASTWVPDEAGEAQKRGVYLPVCIDGTRPPLGFRGSHYANLERWNGSADNGEFQQLLNGVRRYTGKGQAAPEPPAGLWRRVIAAMDPRGWAPIVRLCASLLPAVIVGAWVAVLAAAAEPVQIQLRVIVSQATLTFDDAFEKGVIASYPAKTLTIGGFKGADLGFGALESTGPKLDAGRVRLVADDPMASATFHDVQCEGIRLPRGSRVTFDWHDGALTVGAPTSPVSVNISSPRLTFACDGCAIGGGDQKPAPLDASSTYTVAFANRDVVAIQTAGSAAAVTLDAPTGAVVLESDAVVSAIDLTERDENGQRASTIVSGSLNYVDLRRGERPLHRREIVTADALTRFYLTRLVVTGEGLQLDMHGQAGRLAVGDAGHVQSALPSRLEAALARSPWPLAAAAAFAAVLGLGIFAAGRRSWR